MDQNGDLWVVEINLMASELDEYEDVLLDMLWSLHPAQRLLR